MKQRCVEEWPADMYPRRRMGHTLSDIVKVWKRAARVRLFSLPGYDRTARRTETKISMELEEDVKNQMDEAQVRLGVDREMYVLHARKTDATEGIAYSG